MKIVILMSGLKMGGAERVAVSLSNFLANQNIDTFLVCFDNAPSSYQINDNVKFINNPNKVVTSRIKGFRQRTKFLVATLKEINPDVIFTMFCKVNYYALYYKYFYNRKVKVVSSERCNPDSIDRKKIIKILNNISSNLCDGFIFQTDRVRKKYSKKLQKKGIVIHNPVSNPLVFKVAKESIRTKKTITSMGRLEYQKGQDIMIKAWHKLANKFPDYQLIIFGEGKKRKELENLIVNLNLQGRVLLPGNSTEAILEVAKSQIFLLTSRYEGMPNALLEAMALGIPSISTDCEMGPSELIQDQINGFLIPVDDVDSLASKIQMLLENPELCNKISIESRKILKTHSIDYIFGEYLAYFSSLLIRKKNFLEKIIKKLTRKGLLNWVSDQLYLKILYYSIFHKKLSLKEPKTFNEKLQWLKLYDRREEYTKMVDKYLVRTYIEEKIGEKYLIPLLGVYDSFEEIDFEKLPKQFVIKCNHDSGGLVVCKDKNKLDIESARNKINKSLARNYYYYCREYPYKNVKPKIIIEKYMEDKENKELIDYKVMCFSGEPKMIFTCNERFSKTGLKVTFFDLNWNKLPFKRHYPTSEKEINKPKNFQKMLEFSKLLSKDIPFLRVDWYEINGKLYFGELTFYPGSGFEEFTPESWDLKIGNWLQLPTKGMKK